jgi:hypothetical protein
MVKRRRVLKAFAAALGFAGGTPPANQHARDNNLFVKSGWQVWEVEAAISEHEEELGNLPKFLRNMPGRVVPRPPVATSRHGKCVLCGTNNDPTRILGHSNFYVCFTCLGEAFAAVALVDNRRYFADGADSTPVPRTRCLICDESTKSARAVVSRDRSCICCDCLSYWFERCVAGVGKGAPAEAWSTRYGPIRHSF